MMKKYLSLFISVMILLTLLSGCSLKNGSGTDDGREQVTIAFWGDQLTEQYGKYLQESFPDVDFTFYVATNSTDFYRFKEERGDLPDILTVRRFALRDVADWKDSLMDLSDTELANTFHQSYLRSYTYDDGTVNWLPACAEVDSIIVNKTLLEENGIDVPTNYEEFVSSCGALSEFGIRPFISNFSADYTCMEILQGLSASVLTSQEGREWRQRYESGQTNQLSEEVWLPVFERIFDFIDRTKITAADLTLTHDAAYNDFVNGEFAMIRGTGEDVVRYSDVNRDLVMMPYYGETEAENWYLTYPAFQVAASKKAEESPKRKQLILEIMTAMLGEEGLQKVSGSEDIISYSNNVTTTLSPAMSNLQPYIDNNQLYIRLASSDMFSVSQQVVQGIITGEYPDACSAFDAFNAALSTENESTSVAAHIETGYSYQFDPDGGNPAASAIMNSVREETGTQLLIGPAVNVAGNIAAGDYTEAELQFLTMGEATGVLLCEMTGDQIYKYVDYVLTTPDKRGSVINDSTLYVSSGFKMTVQKTDTGYVLKKLTIDSQELDRQATYSITVIGDVILMLQDAFDAIGVTEYTRSEVSYKQIIVDRLLGGMQLAEPSNYITLD